MENKNQNANKTVSSNEVRKNNIIDVILANQSKIKKEVNAQADANKTLIDNKTFFTDSFAEGILSKEEFCKVLSRASEDQLEAINSLAKALSNKRKINTSDFPYTDKQKQKCYFIKLFSENGISDFKILNFPGLDKILSGYHLKLYHFQISLEGLYKEATTV